MKNRNNYLQEENQYLASSIPVDKWAQQYYIGLPQDQLNNQNSLKDSKQSIFSVNQDPTTASSMSRQIRALQLNSNSVDSPYASSNLIKLPLNNHNLQLTKESLSASTTPMSKQQNYILTICNEKNEESEMEFNSAGKKNSKLKLQMNSIAGQNQNTNNQYGTLNMNGLSPISPYQVQTDSQKFKKNKINSLVSQNQLTIGNGSQPLRYNSSVSPNQSTSLNDDFQMPSANNNSGGYHHKRNLSNQNSNNHNPSNYYLNQQDIKQLPPLDPKSSNISSNQQFQRMVNKKHQSNDNLQQLNFNTMALGDASPNSPLSKFSQNRKEFTQSQISIGQQANNQVQNLKQRNSNLSSFVDHLQFQQQQQTSGNNRKITVTTSGLIEKFKNQSSLSKQSLNNILQEQQLQNQKANGAGKYSSMAKSPYNVNQTAELLMIHEKKTCQNGPNSRQKKLRSVLQSYQPSDSYKKDNQGIQKFSLKEEGVSPLFKGSEREKAYNNSNHSPSNNNSNSRNTQSPNIHQQLSGQKPQSDSYQQNEAIKQSMFKGKLVNSQIRISRQSSYGLKGIKQDNIMAVSSSQAQVKSKKKVVKRKNDSKQLQLNLSNLNNLEANSSQDMVMIEGALTAKANNIPLSSKLNLSQARKIQLHLNKISQFNLSKNQNSLQYQGYPMITTDDRRAIKYRQQFQSHNSASNQSNHIDFASARLIHTHTNQDVTLQPINSQEGTSSYSGTQIRQSQQQQNIVELGRIEALNEYFNKIDEEINNNHETEKIIDKIKSKLEEENLNSMSSIISKIQGFYAKKIEKVQNKIQQNQSVSPSAYQILQEDNKKQSTQIQSLEEQLQNQQSDLDKSKIIIARLEGEIQQKDNDLSHAKQQSLKPLNDESLQRLQKEIQQLYEQNQEQQKERKRLKKDLKESQMREKDYMSVLKNTSELGKLAIEQRNNQSSIPFQNSNHTSGRQSQSLQKTVPKLNLQKAMQFNMQQSNTQVAPSNPIDSSERGAYQKFKKTHGNESSSEDEYLLLNEAYDKFELDSGKNKDPSQNKQPIPKLSMKQPLKVKKLTQQNFDVGNRFDAAKKAPKTKGFQDEFMDKYDEFSLSWREAIDRERRF